MGTSNPKVQHYANHKRMHPLYHFVTAPLTFVLVLGALAYAIVQIARGQDVALSLLLFGLAVTAANIVVLLRLYAAKVQDRAIRAETALRLYMLTGKPLDRRLTIGQIVALRFAGDEELPALSAQAAETGLRPDDIKKAVRSWQADHHRI